MACDSSGALVETILQIQNLSLGYPGIDLFRRLSLNVDRGTTLAVVGANGSGKSTLIKTILGLQKPIAGRLSWPTGKPRNLGYLAQLNEFDARFPIRVRDLVAMGAWQGFGFRSRLDRKARRKVSEALDHAGMTELSDRALHTLSGGQLQRALFARVILQDAPLILLDEPFAAVDQTTEAHLLSIIQKWKEEGRAVILVIHDLSSVLDHCSHALLLGNGTATFGSVDTVLSPENLVSQNYLSRSQANWMFRQKTENLEKSHV